MMEVSAAVEGVEDLIVIPDGVLMAGTIVWQEWKYGLRLSGE